LRNVLETALRFAFRARSARNAARHERPLSRSSVGASRRVAPGKGSCCGGRPFGPTALRRLGRHGHSERKTHAEGQLCAEGGDTAQ
jgi:hypothetical protein